MSRGRDEVKKGGSRHIKQPGRSTLPLYRHCERPDICLNIQFAPHRETGESLQAIEHSIVVAKVLALVMKRVTECPDANLH